MFYTERRLNLLWLLSVPYISLIYICIYVFILSSITYSAIILYDIQGAPKIYTHSNRDYTWIFSKFDRNIMHGVLCDILSKDDTSHMKARGIE
jgi:hypothetical protein